MYVYCIIIIKNSLSCDELIAGAFKLCPFIAHANCLMEPNTAQKSDFTVLFKTIYVRCDSLLIKLFI